VLATLGRTCFRHRRLVAGLWLVALVGGFALGNRAFGRLTTDFSGSSIESFAGYDRLSASSPYGTEVLAVVDAPSAGDARVRAAVASAVTDLRADGNVARVLDPGAGPQAAGAAGEAAAAAARSTDGRALLLTVDLRRGLDSNAAGGAEDAAVATVEQRLRRIGADSGAAVTLGGNHLLNAESNAQTQKDTELGEAIALPLTLLVMVVLFGGLAAAGIPLAGALVSIAGGLTGLLGWSYLLDLDPSVASVTTVLGLGLSIDYSLLVITRYREERGRGRSAEDAVAAAMGTAGRTIAFSALTVAISLSGMFFFNLTFFHALAAAGVSVVLVALVAALTVTPAFLGLFRNRISAPTAPVPDDGFFARLARRVQRRPWLVTLGIAGILLASGSPFLGVHFRNGGADLLPHQFESRRFADLVAQRFPGQGVGPVLVVAQVPATRLDSYAAQLQDAPGVARALPAQQRPDGWSLLQVYPTGTDSQSATAQRLVHDLRDQRPDFATFVTGDAAVLVDFKQTVRSGIPAGLGVVAVGTFVLLFLMTGSVLVPLKALVMNILSLGATFGVLVVVFQRGFAADLLGFSSTGGLETWVPVIVFAFAFGLSMDYETFLLSRIKELYDSGLPNNRAVEVGLQRSGRVITSAGLLVFIVFLGFAAGELTSIKELGLAMAVAVLVDATLVRCLLVPATMTLLGDWNWWAPAPLRRLHARLGLRETGTAVDPAPPQRTRGRHRAGEPARLG